MFKSVDGIIGGWEEIPIKTFKPDPDEIIVFKFKTEPLDLNNMSQIFNNIQNAFPNNTVVAIPDNSCFEVFTKNTLISFLQDIIKQLEE